MQYSPAGTADDADALEQLRADIRALWPPGAVRERWLGWAERIQPEARAGTDWTATPGRQHHAPVRVLTHIKKLDDCFGQFLVRVSCQCGFKREVEPEALARLVGWKVTFAALTPRLRCSQCGKKAAEVVAVARPRPRGVPKNPH